ncbi:sugar phosphate isomerase/epimerase [Fontisphaera persica]|uniref:sugar phosphate isomerase/epimerase family protein n=1 Tax=Fontisphaera persica TaxID=2974023 RepID=UPI0024C06518|nr:sugar phosphate isomerase/epimerase family protein [Fontisphaera persica]WCJ58658.1 sugar phosphate isomerase/epimerase [Fontisphaera persica]
MTAIPRRSFLRWTGSAALLGTLLPASAMEPLQRPGRPRLIPSLAAYSFRNYFQKPGQPRSLDMFGFVDYCAEQGLPAAEVTSYYFPRPVTREYLLRLRRHAFLRGVALSGTAVGNNFARPKGEALQKEIASVKEWIDYAAILGAPHIRIFAGPAPKEIPLAEATRNCLEAIEECCAYAGEKGVMLGLENHGGIVTTAEQLLALVKAVRSPWFGVNLDTGNFTSEDPYAELAACAPYAVNVQIKVEVRRQGAPKPEPADLPRLVRILREANYQGYVALEYEAAEDPWDAVPRWLKAMQAALAS